MAGGNDNRYRYWVLNRKHKGRRRSSKPPQYSIEDIAIKQFQKRDSVKIFGSSGNKYTLNSDHPTVNEGDVFSITLTTEFVPDGTLVPYTITGIQDEDLNESLIGNFVVNNNFAIVFFSTVNDFIVEDNETLILSLDNGQHSISIQIIDTSISSFSLKSNKESVNEGNSFIITLETEGVDDDTLVPYTITGIQSTDISESLTGNFEIRDNVAQATFNVSADFITEGTQTFIISLDNGQDSKSVQINDTSVETYVLSANKTSVDEGDSFTVALSTRGVLDNVLVPYTITGVSSADFRDITIPGNTLAFDVSNNTDTVTFDVIEDFVTEGTETFTLALVNGKASENIIIVDTSSEIYNLSANKTSVNEGDSFTVALSTRGVADDITVPYTITGVSSADIGGALLTSAFSISGGFATATYNVSADLSLNEGVETFNLALDNNVDDINVIINDTSFVTYNLSANKTSVNEGDSFTVALSTLHIPDSTSLPYTITGVTSNDISGVSLTDNFIINNNLATKTFNVSADFTTEVNETFTLSLNNNIPDPVSVLIIDSSVETYNLSANKTSVNEGDSFTVALSTQGIADGASLGYTVGGIAAADINESRTGNFTINNNQATTTFSVVEDSLTEGTETFSITLDNGKSNTENVTIVDTSVVVGYSLASNVSNVAEGGSFTVTLTTVGVAAGTVLPYTISGVSSSDIGGVSLTGGSFTVGADGTAQVTFNVTEDFTVETAETFTLSLNLP